jgi:alkanesulfonate monooxygenase SsuD/methylene tetrahydromethanopterin reductase-like flavin-dependent oxidoreductase (luciferase family)
VTRPRIGTVFIPDLPPSRLRELSEAAEAAGLDDLWVWEDCFKEAGISSATAMLGWTSRVRVGIGLLPVPLRNVAITAMEIATVAALFPGRFAPAIGHGVQSWMGQVGARVESPLTLLREYADALQRLLAGETVTVAGRYVTLDTVTLDWPPDAVPPILIGGEGPKTLLLASTSGAGTVLTSALTEEQMLASIATIREASGGRGTDGAKHEIVAHLMITRGADAVELLAGELREWPTAKKSAGIAAREPGDVATAIDRLATAGATTVLLHGVGLEPDPIGLVDWIGREVAPLVSA